ncbi:hypothetical protein CYMTET_9702 [Cymbomonas tetramitiformis]|uniref:Uncharacterized protein n=1 Tax=Cymbomonas tetramitiformis TaxID=36881 RepID=A0AAE0GQY8_9CHLO|nr:hypothetical protein CYMTET_9702 [Cymbomonas tetramitiformis]
MDRYNSLDANDESNRHRLSAPDVDPDALVYRYPRHDSPKLNVTSDAPLKPILEFNAGENLGKAEQDASDARDPPNKPQLPSLAHAQSTPPELKECSSLSSMQSFFRTPKGGGTQPQSADHSERSLHDMSQPRRTVFQDGLHKGSRSELIRVANMWRPAECPEELRYISDSVNNHMNLSSMHMPPNSLSPYNVEKPNRSKSRASTGTQLDVQMVYRLDEVTA